MPSYRIYLLDAGNLIIEGINLECANDEAACAVAKSTFLNGAIAEVWAGIRLVGQVATIGPPVA